MLRFRHLTLVVFLFCCTAASAWVELDMRGDFSVETEEGLPSGWVLHPAFRPFPSVSVVPGKAEGEKAVRIAESESGTRLHTSRRQNAAAGDRIRISGAARGRGEAGIGIQLFSPRGESHGAIVTDRVVLGDSWRPFEFYIRVPGMERYPTGRVNIVITLPEGAEGEFTRIRAFHEKGEHRGQMHFPREWTVFLPVDREYAPPREKLETVPDSLGGVPGKIMMLEGDTLDFESLFGEAAVGGTAWAFAVVESDYEMDATLGAGADWWMQYFVNGSKIIDTMDSGNTFHPPGISDHTASARLAEGTNVLAVRFVSGRASSVLALGGPDELRSLAARIELTELISMDDYEDGRERPGSPELIRGFPAPGILSPEGQAVYTAAPEVRIYFPGESFVLPPAIGGSYAAAGMRLQSFGRTRRADSECRIDITELAGDARLSLRIAHAAGSDSMVFEVSERRAGSERVLDGMNIPYASLPADIILGANRERYAVNFRSLSDGSFRSMEGASGVLGEMGGRPARSETVFRAVGAEPAEMVVGRRYTGISAMMAERPEDAPIVVEPEEGFDPDRAGWRLVFEDNFEGDEIDPDRWFISRNPHMVRVEDGRLVITADFDDEGYIESSSVYSRKTFLYGYFEARLRFVEQPGWWSAFWLNPHGPMTNAFLDGFEIDIHEDYYLRRGRERKVLDHNLHIRTGRNLKSWNYNAPLPGPVDDFYVIAAKWTPFEISYYLNGELIKSSAAHSPYRSVTFDAGNHGFSIMPVPAILSGCFRRGAGPDHFAGDPADGDFPEEFIIDYVRVYEYPMEAAPRVGFIERPSGLFAEEGQLIRFEAAAEPAAGSGAQIDRVYLFSNGFLLGYADSPPYVLELAIDKEHYYGTPYMEPGRSGIRPELDGYPQIFVAAARDSGGNVGFSEPVPVIPSSGSISEPYMGEPQRIPGTVRVGRYDEGGQGVAYYDATDSELPGRVDREKSGPPSVIGNVRSGEWLNYTVHVDEPGKYDAEVRFGSDLRRDHRIMLFIDGEYLGEFNLGYTGSWALTESVTLRDIYLRKGEGVITLLLAGGFNFGDIEFSPARAQ